MAEHGVAQVGQLSIFVISPVRRRIVTSLLLFMGHLACLQSLRMVDVRFLKQYRETKDQQDSSLVVE